jgi:poly(beta-D-mannuronate) lyase
VVDAIHVWAEAGALSRLETMNAQISAPSRLAGLAMAYLQVKPYASDIKSPHQAVIEDWLEERTLAMMEYFDDDAPQNASRNNLRAWAGFAAAAVSQSTGNRGIADWAAETVELVACQADEDGALPLEMGRGSRALQYQLHAVAPLVVTAAMLSDERRDLFQLCDDAIHRIVGFVPLAFEDPELVNDKAGEEQTYFLGEDELEGFELAWADAYLSRFDSPELAALVETYRPLANSKLGGDQERLW